MPYLSHTEDMAGVADLFLHDPGRYAPLLQFIETVMTRDSQLSKEEREILAAHVSRQNGCDFCVSAHRWTLAAFGVEQALIDSLDRGAESPQISPSLAQLLRFAEKLTQSPSAMGRADIALLLEAGWSEQAVEDAVAVISLFNLVNRLVDALGFENEDSYFRQIGKTLATRGYAPLIQSALKRAS